MVQLINECEFYRMIFEQHHMKLPGMHFKKYFPRGCCQEMANTLGEYLHIKGYGVWNYTWGVMRDNYVKTHGWLQKDGIVCDISLDQFGKNYPSVYVGDIHTYHYSMFEVQNSHKYDLNGEERQIWKLLEKYIK